MMIASSHVWLWYPGIPIKYDIAQFDINILYLVKEVFYITKKFFSLFFLLKIKNGIEIYQTYFGIQ